MPGPNGRPHAVTRRAEPRPTVSSTARRPPCVCAQQPRTWGHPGDERCMTGGFPVGCGTALDSHRPAVVALHRRSGTSTAGPRPDAGRGRADPVGRRWRIREDPMPRRADATAGRGVTGPQGPRHHRVDDREVDRISRHGPLHAGRDGGRTDAAGSARDPGRPETDRWGRGRCREPQTLPTPRDAPVGPKGRPGRQRVDRSRRAGDAPARDGMSNVAPGTLERRRRDPTGTDPGDVSQEDERAHRNSHRRR